MELLAARVSYSTLKKREFPTVNLFPLPYVMLSKSILSLLLTSFHLKIYIIFIMLTPYTNGAEFIAGMLHCLTLCEYKDSNI